MTPATIRHIEGQAFLDALYPLTNYAFHSSPPLGGKEEWSEWVRHREGVTGFAVFEEDGAPGAAACMASTAMIQNVRGRLFGMGGVWGVATHPAARHRGHCRRLMTRHLAAMHENGRPLSGLYPFRESFYERLGYVCLAQARKAQFSPLTLAPLAKASLGGQVELLLIGDGIDAYRAYLRQMQQHTHGMALIEFPDTFSAQRNRFWLAVARVGGDVAGIMLYGLQGEREGEFNLRAARFYYHTSLGRHLLLQWIARHIDQANRVELTLSPTELPETWLPDMSVTVETADLTPMGRVVDVAAIGGMHTGPGRFSAQVLDPLCPWNEGKWRFETVNGLLQVTPTQEAECALAIQGLSALVYGPYDAADLPLRGWGNPSPDTQAAMRAMFPRMVPYIHETF